MHRTYYLRYCLSLFYISSSKDVTGLKETPVSQVETGGVEVRGIYSRLDVQTLSNLFSQDFSIIA